MRDPFTIWMHSSMISLTFFSVAEALSSSVAEAKSGSVRFTTQLNNPVDFP